MGEVGTSTKLREHAAPPKRKQKSRLWRVQDFEGPSREAAVTLFCHMMRTQRFCRIVLPEASRAAMAALHKGTAEFFALDQEVKDAVGSMTDVEDNPVGYRKGKFREQLETHVTGSAHIGTNPCPTPDGELRAIPCPPHPSGYMEAMKDCYQTLEDQAVFYLSVLAEGIGMDPNFFMDLLCTCGQKSAGTEPTPAVTSSILRILKYDSETSGRPGEDDKELLCEAHMDQGFVTIDPLDDVAGLEVQDGEGNWRMVEAEKTVPGEAVIIVGESLAKVSNCHYPAAMHRVVRPPEGHQRIACPFLCRGIPDAIVDMANVRRLPQRQPAPTLGSFTPKPINELTPCHWTRLECMRTGANPVPMRGMSMPRPLHSGRLPRMPVAGTSCLHTLRSQSTRGTRGAAHRASSSMA